MTAKDHMSRITIDIPSEYHKRLKSEAALLGKSMREIVVGIIHDRLSKGQKSKNEKG